MSGRRVTRWVRDLAPHEVFVFGSNEVGVHGKGAAAQAQKFGARRGVGNGPAGQTYGIPTKMNPRKVLPIGDIRFYAEAFERYAAQNPHLHFLVTEVGCGLAGYEPEQIAPLFLGCSRLKNVWLPSRFWDVLEGKKS